MSEIRRLLVVAGLIVGLANSAWSFDLSPKGTQFDRDTVSEWAMFLEGVRAVEIECREEIANLFGLRCVVMLENHGIKGEKLFCVGRLFFEAAIWQPVAKPHQMVIESGDCVALLGEMMREHVHDEAIADALRRDDGDFLSVI